MNEAAQHSKHATEGIFEFRFGLVWNSWNANVTKAHPWSIYWSGYIRQQIGGEHTALSTYLPPLLLLPFPALKMEEENQIRCYFSPRICAQNVFNLKEAEWGLIWFWIMLPIQDKEIRTKAERLSPLTSMPLSWFGLAPCWLLFSKTKQTCTLEIQSYA